MILMIIKDMITHKMYFLDILSNSPHYLYSKGIAVTKENFNFDLRVERVNSWFSSASINQSSSWLHNSSVYLFIY